MSNSTLTPSPPYATLALGRGRDLECGEEYEDVYLQGVLLHDTALAVKELWSSLKGSHRILLMRCLLKVLPVEELVSLPVSPSIVGALYKVLDANLEVMVDVLGHISWENAAVSLDPTRGGSPIVMSNGKIVGFTDGNPIQDRHLRWTSRADGSWVVDDWAMKVIPHEDFTAL